MRLQVDVLIFRFLSVAAIVNLPKETDHTKSTRDLSRFPVFLESKMEFIARVLHAIITQSEIAERVKVYLRCELAKWTRHDKLTNYKQRSFNFVLYYINSVILQTDN